MPPKLRSAGDTENELELLRALEARKATTKDGAEQQLPFTYRPGMPQDPRSLTALQRSAGNAAVGTLLRTRPTTRRPLHVQRFNPGLGGQKPPGLPPSEVAGSKLGGDGAGGGGAGGPGLAESGPVDASFMIGSGKNARPAPPKDDGGAGRAAVDAAATGERAAIVADAALTNKQLDAELATANKKLDGQIGAAKNAASGAVAGATATTTAFVMLKYVELMNAAGQAEQLATKEATAMTAAAQIGAVVAHNQMQATVATIGSGIQGRIGGVVNQITGAIGGISLPDLPGVSAVRSGINSLVRGAANGVTAGITFVQGLVSRALSAGLAGVSKVIGMASNAVMNVIQRVGAAIRNAATKAVTAIMNIAGKVSNLLSAFLRGVVFPALDKLKSKISGHFSAGVKRAKQAVKANTDYHLKTLDKVAKTAPSMGGSKGGGGGGASDDPAAAFKAIGKQSKDNNKLVVNLFQGRFGSVLAGVTAMAMGAAATVGQKVMGLASQVISTVAERVQGALAVVKQIGSAVASFAQTILGSLRTAFTNVVNWVRNVATNPVEQLVNFGSGALSKARNFISTAISNVLRGNFSLPSLGVGAFRPTAATEGPVPTEAVTASIGSSSTSILSIVGIVVAALVGLVMLPFIIGALAAVVLAAAAAIVVFGPLAAVIALVLYGLYKLVKWIFTPSPLKIEHTTQLQAPDGGPKTRVTVGVGERITLKANKLSTWKMSGGNPTSDSPKGQLSWQAPRVGGNAEVTAQTVDKSMTDKVAFTVVEPSSLTAKKEKDKGYPPGTQGAGMELQFIYGPMNVSFGGVEARERSGPASGIKGYYEHEGMPHAHKATAEFAPIAANNQLAGSYRDSASQEGCDPPWSFGRFHWEIPNEFRADEEAPPKYFTTTTQEFVMADDTGTTTINKAGATVTRKP